jgi:hypothetical protein
MLAFSVFIEEPKYEIHIPRETERRFRKSIGIPSVMI